uniref:hypothetical protein n=1 Tax=uncultured Sphingomonas sp. TaxID=158754 RepID=UPI00258A20CB
AEAAAVLITETAAAEATAAAEIVTAAAETIALVAPTPAAIAAAALVVTHNPVRLPGPPERLHRGHAQDGERGSPGADDNRASSYP